MKRSRHWSRAAMLFLGAALAATAGAANAQTKVTVLHAFAGLNGAHPEGAAPIMDSSGNIYGTTAAGGKTNTNCQQGCGVIYKLAPTGKETVLYTFTGGADGIGPIGGVIRDNAGNLYGTAVGGGTTNAICSNATCGTVYKLSPQGKFTVLHTFSGGADGGNPFAGLIMDKSGNLYGTTEQGGGETQNCGRLGCGTVYRITPTGTETVLYSFHGYQVKDGYNPLGALTMDNSGTIFGTTFQGGTQTCNCGTIFALAPDGTETVLHRFLGQSGNDGSGPSLETLVRDSAGNLYGTTSTGGVGYNFGTAFVLSLAKKITILHSFTGLTDGGYVEGGLTLDPSTGNFYGTTILHGAHDVGTLYAVTPTGGFDLLYAFTNYASEPYTSLLLQNGALFGGTFNGGKSTSACSAGCGTIYSVTLPPS